MDNGAPVLSSKQLQILNLLAEGNSRKQIAAAIGLKEKTVGYHMDLGENPRSIAVLTNSRTTAEMVRFAVENGLVKKRSSVESEKPDKPVNIKGVDDLEQAVLTMAERAVAGKVDVLQTNALCLLADTFIKLERFKQHP
jgi:hypothetical protein